MSMEEIVLYRRVLHLRREAFGRGVIRRAAYKITGGNYIDLAVEERAGIFHTLIGPINGHTN